VYDNETGDVLFNGKDEAKTFNVKASSSDDSGLSTGLIVIILIAVIAILVVVVVVISRRNNDDDFDDLYDDEDDKSYASIPPSQSYSAPAAQVSPEMAEAMEKFNFWTQEEIQGYFDQGWSIQQLEEWLESQ
jgi:FtsZ-interacting cell division protein ZipA